MRNIGLALVLGVSAVPALGAELALAPSDSLIAVSARNRGYYDLIVPTIMVRADPGERLSDVSLTIDLLKAGQTMLTRTVHSAELAADTDGLAETGVAGFVNGQVLSATGLAGLFGKPTTFAKSATIEAGQALGSFGNAFVTKGAPDQVRVIVTARNANNAPLKLEKVIGVAEYKSAIQYQSPVKGTWLMTTMPGLRSHHRFNPPSEFALDFFRADADGRIWHGDSSVAANFYGFGAEVLAAANGVVVAVTDGEMQDRAMLIRKPDEAPEAAGRRIQAYNFSRYMKDFPLAAAGNLVVIKHQQQGTTEFSAYGHLRAGVPVKVGQAVRQGEKIGEVGDTGDSAAAHLHFQVNAGPDPFTSKSLPVRLAGIQDPTGIDDVMETITAK